MAFGEVPEQQLRKTCAGSNASWKRERSRRRKDSLGEADDCGQCSWKSLLRGYHSGVTSLPLSSKRSITLLSLSRRVVACTRCDRLRDYCTEVGRTKRRAFADWDYWTRPVPGFGDPAAWLWIVGLAPAAHGANRTGRVFTGDAAVTSSSQHCTAPAWQTSPPASGMTMALPLPAVTSAQRPVCPSGQQADAGRGQRVCRLPRSGVAAADRAGVPLALGKIAWDASLSLARRHLKDVTRADFGHGATVRLADDLHLVGSYHVSQQNTFTGKLTEKMFDDVLARCRTLASC